MESSGHYTRLIPKTQLPTEKIADPAQKTSSTLPPACDVPSVPPEAPKTKPSNPDKGCAFVCQNGAAEEHYRWSQTIDEITLYVDVGGHSGKTGLRGKDIDCKVTATAKALPRRGRAVARATPRGLRGPSRPRRGRWGAAISAWASRERARRPPSTATCTTWCGARPRKPERPFKADLSKKVPGEAPENISPENKKGRQGQATTRGGGCERAGERRSDRGRDARGRRAEGGARNER